MTTELNLKDEQMAFCAHMRQQFPDALNDDSDDYLLCEYFRQYEGWLMAKCAELSAERPSCQLTDAELRDPEYMRAYVEEMHDTLWGILDAPPQKPVAYTAQDRLQSLVDGTARDGCTNMWIEATVDDVPLYAHPPSSDRFLQIIACAYQMAGVHDAPEVWLDVLSNPEEATQEQIDALLPYRSDTLPDSFDGQDWAKTSGAVAWHLIDRHADNWAETGDQMEAWAKAWYPAHFLMPVASMPVEKEGISEWLRRRSTQDMCCIPGRLAGEIADHIDALLAEVRT